MENNSNPFSLTGRANRTTFAWTLATLVFIGLPAFCILAGDDDEDYDSLVEIVDCIAVVFLLALAVLSAIVAAKRIKDIGKSMWMMILFFIPIVNFFFWYYLSIAPSQYEEDNSYRINPFIFEGRMRRLPFFLITFFASVVDIILSFSMNTLDKMTDEIYLSYATTEELLIFIGIYLSLLIVWGFLFNFQISSAVKRVKDVRGGTAVLWLACIPIVNIGLWLYLIFAKPQPQ